jgi:hypothetical protein
MRIIMLAASVFVAGATLMASPARANVEFAYCSAPGFAVGQDCSFTTLGQCQAAVQGLGTFCFPNPRFRAATSVPATAVPTATAPTTPVPKNRR